MQLLSPHDFISFVILPFVIFHYLFWTDESSVERNADQDDERSDLLCPSSGSLRHESSMAIVELDNSNSTRQRPLSVTLNRLRIV
jgi:hypothetical protein